jgi:hypothetical protein
MIFPFIYDCDRSIEVYDQTKKYLEETGYKALISEFGWAYYSIGDLIPQTTENLWSGHFVPWSESWNEIQVSFNLCLFGFYKQAMVSLRGGLELGLLSVYWNLNDDGHKVIKDWLKSLKDTPRFDNVWKKLEKHPNFQSFQKKYDIKPRLLALGFLHNYVHAKGYEFSNYLGMPKSNYQTFESVGIQKWLNAYQEVIIVLCILHLVKYPIGTIEFDYFSKFGYDIPSFGGLDEGQVARLEKIIGEERFGYIQDVSQSDPTVQNLLSWIDDLPTMTREELDNQVIEMEKPMIEQIGFEKWARSNSHFLESEHFQGLFDILKNWAHENGFEKSQQEKKSSPLK